MKEKIEKQRKHFDEISEKYTKARKHANHILLKDLIWAEFLKRNKFLSNEVERVLEPMCGTAEGFDILTKHLKPEFEYQGFDYSENMVRLAKQSRPGVNVAWNDVSTYSSNGEKFDCILLIGGLHHVFSRAQDVVQRLSGALRVGGFFITLEPTQNNVLMRNVRRRIYDKNELFDSDTEQGFEYNALEKLFEDCGYSKIDQVFPGLLSYILYYNPDAFPGLNFGGGGAVKTAFKVDRWIWDNWLGRKLSFATLSVWKKS